uniref:(California timema) hypothetical protein n=1 Tax=Timema californicum TaxID=61474 RepID=A0A7R9IXC6_TIMCA|nr:unnamed protein product [Timema californicum]
MSVMWCLSFATWSIGLPPSQHISPACLLPDTSLYWPVVLSFGRGCLYNTVVVPDAIMASQFSQNEENPSKIVKRALSDKSNGVPPAKMVRSNSVNNDEIQKTSLASTSFCTISPRKPTTSNLLDRPANIQRPVTPHLDLKKVTETLKNKNICPSTMTFGFLGLGIMGSGIVKNLLHSGHTVIVWNRNPDKVEVMGGGGKRVLDDAVHSASMALSFFFPPLPLGVSHGESCNGK